MVADPIRLSTHWVDTLLRGGSEIRVNYSGSEYGYDLASKEIVPIKWFLGQLLYVQERFDIEPSGKFDTIVYYRADYPNNGWRTWIPGYFMSESQSRLKLKVLHVDEVRNESEAVSWILTVERRY